MLKAQRVDFTYRDYKAAPLSPDEIRAVIGKLEGGISDAFAARSRPNRELGLTGTEDLDILVAHMAEHPTLMKRPIAVFGERAIVARPPQRMLELLP